MKNQKISLEEIIENSLFFLKNPRISNKNKEFIINIIDTIIFSKVISAEIVNKIVEFFKNCKISFNFKNKLAIRLSRSGSCQHLPLNEAFSFLFEYKNVPCASLRYIKKSALKTLNEISKEVLLKNENMDFSFKYCIVAECPIFIKNEQVCIADREIIYKSKLILEKQDLRTLTEIFKFGFNRNGNLFSDEMKNALEIASNFWSK